MRGDVKAFWKYRSLTLYFRLDSSPGHVYFYCIFSGLGLVFFFVFLIVLIQSPVFLSPESKSGDSIMPVPNTMIQNVTLFLKNQPGRFLEKIES